MNHTLKNIFRFASGSTIGGIFNFLTFFVVAKIVGPENWGIWMIFNIILKFSPLVQLGAIESVQRQVPILLAKKNETRATKIQDNAMGYSLLKGLILTLLVVILGPFIFKIDFIYCLLFAPILFLNLINYNFGVVFRSHNQFKKVGLISLLSGFFSLLSILLTYEYFFEGFLFGQLIRFGLTLLVTLIINNVKVTPEFNWIITKELIKDGIPISLIVLSNYLITLSDRLIIAHYFDTTYLGLYGLAYLLINPFLLISAAINSVFYTKISAEYSNNQQLISTERIFALTKIIIAIFSFSIGLVYIIMPLLISEFLTDYEDGLAAARLLLIGNIFFFSSGLITNVFFTLNKQLERLKLIIAALIINVVSSLFLLEFYNQIESVAIGSLLSFFILFAVLIIRLKLFNEVNQNVNSIETLKLIIFPCGFVAFLTVLSNLNIVQSNFLNLTITSIFYIFASLLWCLAFIKKKDVRI